MRRKSSIFKLLAVLVLSLFFVGGLLFIEWIRPTNNTDKIPVPEKHNWMVHMDGANFWKKEVYTVLFEAKDVAFLNQLRAFVEEKLNDEESEKYPLAISINSTVTIVQFDYHNKQYVATYFDVTNPEKFLTNSQHVVTDQQVSGTHENKGIILTSLTPNNAKINCDHALAYLLRSKEITLKSEQKTSIQLSVNTKDVKGKLVMKLVNKSICFNGKITLFKSIQPNIYSLKPAGFTIQSNYIPNEINQLVANFTSKKNISLPAITSCHVDYLGLQLADEKPGLLAVMGYVPIPKMNALISFEKPVTVAQFASLFPESVRESNERLNFGSVSYLLKQLDAHTLFVGCDPAVVVKQKEKSLVTLSGDLNQLLKIDGNSFIAGFIQNMPPVKATSDFMKTIATSSLRILPTSHKNEYTVNGSIAFKNEKQAINECAKLGFSLWKIYK